VARDFERQLAGVTTLRPSRGGPTYPYGTVGLAIDYRLRYYFEAHAGHLLDVYYGAMRLGSDTDMALAEDRIWVPSYGPGSSSTTQMPRVAKALFDDTDVLLTRIQPVRRRLARADETALCQRCFALALFDRKLSANLRPERSSLAQLPADATLDQVLALANGVIVDDLVQLSSLFYDRHASFLDRQVELTPVCNDRRVGAAPDMVADRYVIDFKTTIHPKLDPLWLYQVLGYVLLEAEQHLELEGVGFYLVRQGKFVGWTLQSLIPALTGSKSTTIEHFRGGFKGSISKALYR
jgi:hypothetical protein